MEDSVLKLLENGSEDDVLRLLKEFNLKVSIYCSGIVSQPYTAPTQNYHTGH